MITKLLEIRDEGAFIPVLAIELDSQTESERYLLARAGFGTTAAEQRKHISIWKLDGGDGQCTSDAHAWTSRTMTEAHKYIKEHWYGIQTGDVIDVEFILGETRSMKMPERLRRLE